MKNPWTQGDPWGDDPNYNPYPDGNPMPPTENDGGTQAPADDGMMDTNIDANGVMQYGQTFRVDRNEWNRRWDLNIKLNPNGGGAKTAATAGSGSDTTPGSRPVYNFKPVPQFDAPEFSYDQQFVMPDKAAMEADPGYQFRMSQGQKALEASAAAKGVLRTGGTLKGIHEYGQQFASQEYGNVFDRSLSTYGTNYGVARDVFDRKYAGAKDEYAPKLFEWQTLASAEQNAANMGFEQLWKKWFNDHLSAADIYSGGQ